MCTVFLDRAGSCEGTQLERGMCRLACFHWNVACIVSQTINRCLLAFFTPPFHVLPLRNPSGPNRSHAHGFMSKAVVAITLVATEKRRLCGFRNAWMSFQQALFLWGSSSVWICVLLWWIIKKRTQWMLSCSEDETLIWWKETAPQWNHVWQLEDNLLK